MSRVTGTRTEELRYTCPAITTGDIKRKIETLRNQHRREMRLVENSRKSGAGIDDLYIPRLWCFNELSFLNDGDTVRPSLSNIDNATNDTAEEHSDHEVRTVCAPVCLSLILCFRILVLHYHIVFYISPLSRVTYFYDFSVGLSYSILHIFFVCFMTFINLNDP